MAFKINNLAKDLLTFHAEILCKIGDFKSHISSSLTRSSVSRAIQSVSALTGKRSVVFRQCCRDGGGKVLVGHADGGDQCFLFTDRVRELCARAGKR